MTDRPIKIPGPDHPITVEPTSAHVRVMLGDRVLADTRAALVLREARYPDVYYFPRGDVDMSLLARTAHETYCPFKGDCTYYSLPEPSERAANAVWSYEAPFEAVAVIKDHLAFYPDRVSIEVS